MAAGGALRLGFLQADGDSLYWQEGRPDGRTVLVRWRDGVLSDHGDVRSRVHEYGGRGFAARAGALVTEEDGPTGDHFIGADGSIVFVREDANPLRTSVVASLDGFEREVASGRDFYAAPRLSDDGRLAYLCWDAPHMPWDAAELWVDGEHVAGGNGVSAMQPGWLADGSLQWIDDRSGWWNLHGQPIDAEVGYPQWQLGFQNWTQLHDGTLAFTARSQGFDQLIVDGKPLDLPFSEMQFLVPFRDGLAAIAGGPRHHPGVVAIAPDGTFEVLHASSGVVLDEVTVARHVTFGHAHALLHTPPDAHALVVRAHGGPTAQASSALDLEVQFFTSRGYAVADVDYRGSTGYGRAFRDSLRGRWGVADVEDCVACVEQLGFDRAVIRGSSAGGCTVLRALTTTDVFAAGSSRYGVADLVALDEHSHRFEAHYTRQLVGPDLAERSPIRHLDGFSAPVVLFQGAEDRVVAPEQAHAMAAALEAKGLDHELHVYEGEGHGFRRAETRRAVLEAEAAFFARAVGSRAS